jgi:phenylpyruvate tautomerase
MPSLKLETTVDISEEKQKALLMSLSRIMAETIGKPEQYVMVTVSQVAGMMSGKAGATAFVDIRSIGALSPMVNRKLSQKICDLLEHSLKISPERVYLNFTEVTASNWGWNGNTFG